MCVIKMKSTQREVDTESIGVPDEESIGVTDEESIGVPDEVSKGAPEGSSILA